MLSKMFLHGVAAAAAIAVAAGLYAASALETPPLGEVTSAQGKNSAADTGYRVPDNARSKKRDAGHESRHADRRADHKRQSAKDDGTDED